MGRGLAAAVLVLVLGMGRASVAGAHQSDESMHVVEIDQATGQVEQLVSVSGADLAHHLGWLDHGESVRLAMLEPHQEEMASYMVRRVRVWADGQACRLEDWQFVNLLGQDGRVHLHVSSTCAERPEAVTLENRIMMEGAGGYRHMGRAQVGERVWPMVFDVSFPTFVVDLPVVEGGAPDAEAAEASASAEPGHALVLGGVTLVVALGAVLLAVGAGRRSG
ncbi:hypothetical protein DL240_17990 [Lujinxingia litoralis]|uniref:Uncharacterized protein n=2 Tax=Lujinxingia litoralis TaxID=2211119 RepID=A0A328C5H7_9DELT|nr:hypothetical protein DL240_17990 [Lujinxingia litoralis]